MAPKGVVTPEEIGAEQRGKGQLLVLTLTIKNIGHHVATVSTDGAVKWQDEKTSPRVATTDEAVDGPELDTEYKPGAVRDRLARPRRRPQGRVGVVTSTTPAGRRSR
ncbi:hypothetical protein [Streptomyces sp. RKAG290]|uniref:hypothetical protein n=1 Tax=Streptomyces sp. RKAG290 TaxID=2888348 RepID=UPI002033253A|nr:hypothetical protein [Streptomyces sp. RKAG290]MCM2412539.1 hypothetical protein [Streptomyces sp. RKAG290]